MRIRTKLLALIAVPVLAIGLAAAVGFAAQSRAIETAESSTETVAQTDLVYDAVLAVGAERLLEAGANFGKPSSELLTESDDAVQALAGFGLKDLSEELIADLSAARSASGQASIDLYSEINDKLLAVPGDTAEQYPDATSRDNAIVNRLAVESLEAREQAWLLYLSTTEASPQAASDLAVEFATSASGMVRTQNFADDSQIDSFLQSEPSRQLTQLETLAADDLIDQELSVVDADALVALVDFRYGWTSIIEDGTAELNQSVDAELQGANDLRSLFTLLAAIGVVVGAGLIFVIYRSITDPLSSLLVRASQVANEDLPSLVTTLRDSESDGELPTAEVIPVTSNDEIGELVSAFNDVQVTAYDLATEQALGRRAVGEMFVNLGRRNQRLLERILAKLTELQRDEEDPDALASLFELDNIVTRMRRNAESLLVMAGATTPRQWRQSVDIENTVRAAVGEVEGYQKIDITHLDPVDLRGNVVADIAHLLAELLENAVNFSDGDSSVFVSGQNQNGGYVLDVVDGGIGMTAEEFEANNSRITDPPPVDQIPTKFLGLYVVGRLADRHGIEVRLSDAPNNGVLARVELPASLVVTGVDENSAPSSAADLNAALAAPTPTIDDTSVVDLSSDDFEEIDSEAVLVDEIADPDNESVSVSAVDTEESVDGTIGEDSVGEETVGDQTDNEESVNTETDTEEADHEGTDADGKALGDPEVEEDPGVSLKTASTKVESGKSKSTAAAQDNAVDADRTDSAETGRADTGGADADNADADSAGNIAAPVAAAKAGNQPKKKLTKRSRNKNKNKTKRRKEDETSSGTVPVLPTRQKGKALKSTSPPDGVERRAKPDDTEEAAQSAAQGAGDFSAMMSALSSGISKGIEDSSADDSDTAKAIADHDTDRNQKS